MNKDINKMDVIRTAWPIAVVLAGGFWGYANLHSDINYMKADAAVLKGEVRETNAAYRNIEKELAKLQVQSARIEERLIAMQPRSTTRPVRED